MAFASWGAKDPAAIIDYSINWATRWGTDAVEEVEWTLPDDLDLVAQSLSGQIATVRIGGGVAGQKYNVNCHVVLASGQEDEITYRLPIAEQ